MKLITIIIATFLITGCATKIKTYDKEGKQTHGIPVPKPQLVRVETTITYEPKPGLSEDTNICDKPLVVESYDYIASNNFYYINFDPSEFAEGDFEINYNDKGMVTKISVNSKANTGLDSINSLLGTLLPYKSATKAEELTAQITSTKSAGMKKATRKSHCIEKSKKIQIFEFEVKKSKK